MIEVAVTGVGMHPFGRYPDASLKDLARVAVVRALEDAGLGVKDIDAVYSANAMAGLLQGQEQIRGQTVLREVGIERVPIVNVENACASGSSAFREAVIAIRAGVADTVLAVGFEKMFVDDARPVALRSRERGRPRRRRRAGTAVHRRVCAPPAQADRRALDQHRRPRRRRCEEPRKRRSEPVRPVPGRVHPRGGPGVPADRRSADAPHV